MIIYLYKKTHLITGLKYLGKTKSTDPHNYLGSGTYWINHLKKHGYDVETEILKECNTNEEVKTWGLYYIELWDVVNSDDWANVKPESGDGGIPTEEMKKKISSSLTGRKHTKETIEKRRTSNKKPRPTMQGRKWSKDHCEAISKGTLGKKKSNTDKMKYPKSESHRSNISKGKKGIKQKSIVCPHCDKSGGITNMKRYHFDFCKLLLSQV